MKSLLRWVWVLLPVSLSLLGCSANSRGANGLPAGFISLTDVNDSVQLDIRYYTNNNFIGRPIAGYYAAKCVLTESAAAALSSAQELAAAQGYTLKVYDCYRPQQAVNDFVSWAADSEDVFQQHRFYPTVPKNELFSQGYIAERSGHSRGSTVDLTLVPGDSRQPQVDPFANRYDCRQPRHLRYPDNSLEMGTGYDCFDQLSHTDNSRISEEARYNRQLLRSIMEAAGFSNYSQEWWHYTFDDEPYSDRYFNFPIQ